MVHFQMATPLGIPVHDDDFDQAYNELERTGRLASLNHSTIQDIIGTLLRDAALHQAIGRWVAGHPDPADFVPGDVAAIRSIITDPLIRAARAVSLHRGDTLQPISPLGQGLGQTRAGVELILTLHPARMLDQPVLASLLVEVGSAVPYFIPTVAAAAVLASRPPHPDLQQDLRLPFDKVLVLFGADLAFDQASFSWPAAFPFDQLPTFGTLEDMVRRGGYLTGMVLLADTDGRLRDDLIWILAANPNPHQPWPANLDRIRGVMRGWRSAATLAPLVHNVAAAIAWGTWQPPPPAPDLPADPRSRPFRKALKRNSVRMRERQGAVLGVHVLDLGRTVAQAHCNRPDSPHDQPSRASPIPHLRSGHFRRVRVGPRDRFHYEPRWIPPVWVQGDAAKAAQRLVVRRLPAPAAWARARRGVEPASPGSPTIRDPQEPSPLRQDRQDHPFPHGPEDPPFGVELP